MAESNSLLNCRRSNLTAGSNPALSAIFFAKMRDSLNEMKAIPEKHFFAKNGERSRKASLHCAKHNFTSSRDASRSSLNNRYALLACPP